MEQNSRVKYSLERIKALKYDAPKIARVLSSSDGIIESQLGTLTQDGSGSERPVDKMRMALLDNNLQRLKEARKLFKPFVDNSTLMLERIDTIASRLASTRNKLVSVTHSEISVELERLSARIALTEKRLVALNRLMEHLNPSMDNIDYDRISDDMRADSTDCSNIELVLDTADNLIASKKFCDSLSKLEYLKGSAVLLGASQRITANLDKVCELSFLRLQKASRRLSKVLCEAFDEASAIELKHSNSFVPSMPSSAGINDEFGISKIFVPKADPNASLALRALKLLQMRPTYLYHFVNGMRDVLGQISLKHFAAYASTRGVNPCNRSAVVISVLEHLQHNVKFMKECVAGLYGNAGLPFHYSESNEHGMVLMKASNYLTSILELLVNPLEAKLNKIMAADTTKVVDGVITCNGIVDMFTTMQSIREHMEKINDALSTPWVNTTTDAGISIDNQQSDCDTDVEEDEENVSPVGNEFRKEDEEASIVVKLKHIYEEWRKQLFSGIEERIAVPLANEPTCHIDAMTIVDISAPHIIHTICEFIWDIARAQSQYTTSDDLLRIIEMTVNPTINWCQKSAKQYGDHVNAYLINCFAQLQKALDHEAVPQSFKDLLKEELESHVIASVETASTELQNYINIKGTQPGSNEADEIMRKISGIVFADGILGCDLPAIKRLKLIEDSHQRVIKSRLYSILAEQCRNLAADKNSKQILELAEFAAQL
ncbi:hypothetical protein X943_003410 [Babesia divergens]|uniref:Uncharacterized protein n=1 Tax=Babesia divergens TaxID=32595 RepID=A0AAD9GHT9_BABDI|nr:hypothetical protein X943_003410 [Babesia divergens]